MALHYSPKLQRMTKCSTPERCRFDPYRAELGGQFESFEAAGAPNVLKNSYMGISVAPEAFTPALALLKRIMGQQAFEQALSERIARNQGDKLHVTILTPQEFRELKKADVEITAPKNFDFQVTGLGAVTREAKSTWFALVTSDAIQNWRASYGLPPHDLHVTLAFIGGDIHGCKKDSSTLIR